MGLSALNIKMAKELKHLPLSNCLANLSQISCEVSLQKKVVILNKGKVHMAKMGFMPINGKH